MKVTAAAATDIGQVREGNEDSFLAEEPLFAVADGMGGHRGGEVASQLALETLEVLFRQARSSSLAQHVQEANRVVFERSLLDRAVAGMGTTLTAALVEGSLVRLAHVGDSRAYLLRAGEMRLLTEDHTLVHRMVEEGEITAEEAEVHPHRSVLTRALGVDVEVAVDEGAVDVRDGDRLLLCTDGLTAMLAETQIREILSAAAEPDEAAKRLVRAANRAGGVDNITVVVLRFSSEEGGAKEGGEKVQSGRPGSLAPLASPSPTPLREASGPSRGTGSSSAGRIAVWAAVGVTVLVAGLVGVRVYTDSQWFVGVSNGHVAVYRGVPSSVAGFRLHHVVVETSISAADAERLALYRDLADGITAGSRTEAEAIVEQIRKDTVSAPARTTGPVTTP